MADPRVERLADVLVNYCTAIQAGDWVLINGHVLALPLVEQVVREVLRAGGHPTIQLNADELNAAEIEEASEAQLSWVSPATAMMAEQLDARIVDRAPRPTRAT